jgi:hypothetical protein
MNIRDRVALNPDTLIVIHLLNEFFSTMENEEAGLIDSPYTNRFHILQKEVLDDILWGAVSFGNFVRDWPFRYLATKKPPIEDLMELLWEKGLSDTECTFLLPKAKVEYLIQVHQIDALCNPPMDYDEDYASVWKQIVTESEYSPHAVFSTLGKSRLLWRGLLAARAKDFWTPFQTLHPGEPHNIADEETVRITQDYRPFELNFFNNWKEIYVVLRKVEDDYLEDFMEGHIVFVTNHMRWKKKIDYLMPIMKNMHEEHGPFWISLPHLYDGCEVSREFRPVELQLPETLFALQKMGELIVTACKQDQHQDIEFRVHLLEKAESVMLPPTSIVLEPKKMFSTREPIHPDFLLALHLITHSFEGVQALRGEGLLADTEFAGLPNDLLEKIFWRNATYASFVKIDPERSEVPDYPIRILLELCGGCGLHDVEFRVHIDESEADTYQRTPTMTQLLLDGSEREKALWQQVKKGEALSLNVADYKFMSWIIDARDEAIDIANYKGNDIDGDIIYDNFKPIQFSPLMQSAELYTRLQVLLNEYLENFESGSVINWTDNPLQWERQKEYFVPILLRLHHKHKEFWISLAYLMDQEKYEEGEGYKLLESLLNLERKGALQLTQIKEHEKFGVQFKVRPAIEILGKQIAFDQNPNGESVLDNSDDFSNSILEVNGIGIDGIRNEVSYGGISIPYKPKKLPWKIFRMCALEVPDGKGIVDMKNFNMSEDDLNVVLSKINKKWKELANVRLLSLKDGYIYLDPKPQQQGDGK